MDLVAFLFVCVCVLEMCRYPHFCVSPIQTASFPLTSPQSPGTTTFWMGMRLRLSAGELTNHVPPLGPQFFHVLLHFLSFFIFSELDFRRRCMLEPSRSDGKLVFFAQGLCFLLLAFIISFTLFLLLWGCV